MYTTINEPTPILSVKRPADVELSLLFDPAVPLAALDLVVDSPVPPCDDATYLALIDAALARLTLYRADYAAAALMEVTL